MIMKKDIIYAAIPDVIYTINQCLSLHIWIKKIMLTFTADIGESMKDYNMQIVHNAVLESNLLFLRKLNEFFGKRSQKDGDETIRAYHFGDFQDNGWFLTPDEHDELNLRVAHISHFEVTKGKRNWEDIFTQKVPIALEKAKNFLSFLMSNSEIEKELKEDIKEMIRNEIQFLDTFS